MTANISRDVLFSVKDMVVVVTGGGTGIGAMMAKALDANGARKVFILGRRLEKLQNVAAEAPNGSVIPIQCDMSSQNNIEKAATVIESQVPFVNTLIANHGAKGPTVDDLPKDPTLPLQEWKEYFWKASMSDFNQTFMVNTTAVWYCFLAFMSLLDAGNKNPDSPGKKLGIDSQFIITGSIGGFSKNPGMGYAYSASKAGVTHMAKQLATNMVPYHIRVNVFSPGIYPSDMSTNFMAAVNHQVPRSIVPAERLGTIEDAAGLTLFMCSRAGAYLNGSVITPDGGRLAVVPSTW